MDAHELGRRIREALCADRDRGRLGPLSSYQRRFKGCEDAVAREYALLTHTIEGAGLAPDGGRLSVPTLPPAPEHASTAIRSRYAQLGEIARGGMGAILRVRDETLERDLAMKVVLGEPGGRSRVAGSIGPLTRRFLEEAKITARLDHPGVVPVHELGADERGRPYFTMKLIKGGRTLAEVFRLAGERHPEHSLSRVVQTFLRILETLAFAHEKGIIHRDLKPANVMVGDFGEVYVMDWGLAKVLGEPDLSPEPDPVNDVTLLEPLADDGSLAVGAQPGLTEAGQILGTPAYMPLEQARNEALDARADVYAVGAMLYEFLSGVHPFGVAGRECTTAEVLAGMAKGPPEPLARLAPTAPRELVSIVTKAMAREKSDRYATAAEFAHDLRSFVEGKVVLAHETGAWAQVRSWVRRNRALAWAVAAAGLLLVAGLVTSITLGVQADRERDAARRYAYRAGFGAAVADLANQDLYAARRRLEQTPEDLRGWEWRHLAARLDESLAVIDGTGMVCMPDGSLRVIDPAGVVREHDLGRGTSRVLGTVPRQGAEAWISMDGGAVCVVRDRPGELEDFDVSFHSVDGSAIGAPAALKVWDRKWDRGFRMPRFAYAGTDARLHLRDALSGAERTSAALADGEPVQLMGVTGGSGTSDGRFLLLERGGKGLVLDLDTDRIVMSVDYPRVERPGTMAVDAQRSRVALLGEDGGVEIRSLATGELTSFGRVRASAREGFVAFDPTGAVLATGGRDRSVRLFDAATGALLRTLHGHVTIVQEGAFTPNGEYLVTRDAGHHIRIWPAKAADPCILRGHASYVYSVAFSPDGRRIASGGWDGFVDAGGALRIWDAETGTQLAALGDAAKGVCVFTLAWTPDGRRILTVGGERPEFRGGSLRIWDADTGALVRECPGTYRTLGLHPDGRRVVGMQFGEGMDKAGQVCHVVDIESGAVLATFLPKPISWKAFAVDPVCSPDGRLIATTDADASAVVFWDARDYHEVRRVPIQGGSLASVTFSPDGTRFISTADDESWSVWETATGRRMDQQRGTGNEVLTGVYSPDGRTVLTGGRDRTLRIWDSTSFEELARLPGHDDYIKCVAANPSGEVLATASGDRTVRIWQTRTAAELHVAQIERRKLAVDLAPRVAALFDELGDASRVAARLRKDLTGRALEVALQLTLTESVTRADAAAKRR